MELIILLVCFDMLSLFLIQCGYCSLLTLSFLFCQDDKADVILKYMPDEARLLKAYGELPENTRLNEGITGGLDEEEEGAGDDYIEFEDEDIDKI